MSETARLLAESVGAFLTRNRDLDDSGLLEALQESGFTLALASEENGGLGASWSEAATIARLWGYHAAALPIVELLLSAHIADVAGDMRLAARLTVVPSGAAAGGPVSAAVSPGADICLPRAGLAAIDGTAATTIAGEPVVRLGAAAPLAAETVPSTLSHDQLVRQGTLLVAARMLGAMERIVEIVTEHVKVRSQFGRALAKFQLVQTMVADAASEIEAAAAAIDRALRALDGGLPDDIEWRAAKSQAGRAATVVAANAHQAMGAVGFTQEHALHTLTRRLWAWRDAWVSQAEADEAIGRLACHAGGDGLWSLIADRQSAAGLPASGASS